MLLLVDPLMFLSYDPSVDILTAELPNIELFYLPEIRLTHSILLEHVRNYCVKRLLFKAPTKSISPVVADSPQYRIALQEFLIDLSHTHLQKMASVVPFDQERKVDILNLLPELNHESKFAIQYKTFTYESDAIAWLVE